VISTTWKHGADVKPAHGKPPEIATQDDPRHARREQQEALQWILEMGQKDIRAGNFRDLDEFLDELGIDSADI
jgi:hypothetical protein